MSSIAIFGLAMFSNAQVPNYVPSNGLVGWWPFNGNANDESGNGYNLINSNVTWDLDRNNQQNQAAYFNGNTSDLSSSSDLSQLTSSPNQTISFWFKNIENNYRYIVTYGNSTGGRFSICPNTLTSEELSIYGINECVECGSGTNQLIQTPALSNGWHHIVFAIDTDSYIVYYDGNNVGNYAHSGFNCTDSQFRLWLGNDIICSPEWYTMMLDDIGIWNRALTQEEITSLYSGSSLGINEASQSNFFSVYPNPAQSVINVNIEANLVGSVFTIYDNTGKAVKTGKLNSLNTTIEVNDLSGGIYSFSAGGNSKQTFKVIKE